MKKRRRKKNNQLELDFDEAAELEKEFGPLPPGFDSRLNGMTVDEYFDSFMAFIERDPRCQATIKYYELDSSKAKIC